MLLFETELNRIFKYKGPFGKLFVFFFSFHFLLEIERKYMEEREE